MKNRLLLGSVAVLSIINVVKFTTFPVFAQEEPKLSEEKRGLISQNCGTIRQSLKNLQRSDSRARIYFGSIYETFSSHYLTPLNLRLVKNDISEVSLINSQATLAKLREKFSTHFIDYSKSLEDLIAHDCRLDPDGFYIKLQSTRAKRTKVAADTTSLNDLLVSSVKSVEKLKEKYHEK